MIVDPAYVRSGGKVDVHFAGYHPWTTLKLGLYEVFTNQGFIDEQLDVPYYRAELREVWGAYQVDEHGESSVRLRMPSPDARSCWMVLPDVQPGFGGDSFLYLTELRIVVGGRGQGVPEWSVDYQVPGTGNSECPAK